MAKFIQQPPQFLTGDTPPPNQYWCRLLRIPADMGFLMAVNGALAEMTHPSSWVKFGTETPEDSASLATEMYLEYVNSEVCMIGAIFPYATTTPPSHCLPCNGSFYLRADYPTLYDNLAAAYIVDSDTFMTPDLRGRFVVGAEAMTFPNATSGGAAEHTLTEAQMPAHTHTTQPHAHSETGAVPTIINGGIEAPANAATPSPNTTGPASVVVDPAGGGQPFPILPPYTALNYCIVAR